MLKQNELLRIRRTGDVVEFVMRQCNEKQGPVEGGRIVVVAYPVTALEGVAKYDLCGARGMGGFVNILLDDMVKYIRQE